MLSECTFSTRGQRWGFVPFRALCVAERLAAHERLTPREAMHVLQRLAVKLGGEVVEEEVLGLPADSFQEVWRRSKTACCSRSDVASRARTDSVRDREGAVAPHEHVAQACVCAVVQPVDVSY